MSEQDDQHDLGAKPEPAIEPGEPNPGGVDALPVERETLPADLPPEENPAIQGQAPDDVKAAVSGDEDTSTSATRDEDTDDAEESPA